MKRIVGQENTTAIWWGLLAFLALNLMGLQNLQHADNYANCGVHENQLIWTILGFSIAMIAMIMDLSIILRIAPIVYWLGILLLVVVLALPAHKGTHRWINLFGLSIQPSEVMKFLLALMLAHHFKFRKATERYQLRTLALPIVYTLLPTVLVLVEPDLGTSMVICFVGFAIMFFEGVQTRTFLALIGFVLLVFPLAWKSGVIRSYQKQRISSWAKQFSTPWTQIARNPDDQDRQPVNSIKAIAIGQRAGKGTGKGREVRYLSELCTDFVVAALAVERGFQGCLIMLLLYFMYVTWGFFVAQNATDKFGVLVAVGVITSLAVQVIMNLFMVTRMIPVVGVTLPLFSYGGSALITNMIGFGVLLNIARTRGSL
ncbi:MAG: hypothetical protein CMH54_15165 [Myxococcales bacterium]|nr:hypothetical protein [Myxococcales bacterium]|tara:strand:+ start:1192 stop:2307 length:1116 start_codon:yes stop_codon:yes gene_type:complete